MQTLSDCYRTWPPTCYFCGRFMSYFDMEWAVYWTPFGGSQDLEPPENDIAHHRCWRLETEEKKKAIRYISWSKPLRVISKDKYRKYSMGVRA